MSIIPPMSNTFTAELARFGPERSDAPPSRAQVQVYCSCLARTLRELHRRLGAAAAPPDPSFSHRLRLLPLGRRPRRRVRRRITRPVALRLVARRVTELLRWPAAPSCLHRLPGHDSPLPHSAGAVPRSALRLRAGPTRQALSHLRATAGILPMRRRSMVPAVRPSAAPPLMKQRR
jgi:hypothetical protein